MRRGHRSHGFTLAEVTAAMVLTALLAAVASRPFGRGSLAAVDAESAAAELALTLQSLRQQAILTGREHGVRLVRRSSRIRRVDAWQSVNGKRVPLATRLDIDFEAVPATSPLREMGFTAEGTATIGGIIEFTTEHRTWQVQVLSLTGVVRVSEP